MEAPPANRLPVSHGNSPGSNVRCWARGGRYGDIAARLRSNEAGPPRHGDHPVHRPADHPAQHLGGPRWVAPAGAGLGREPVPPALIFGHGLLAATGLIIWIIYLVTDTDGLRWVAFAILLVVATLGFTMAARWRQERGAAEAATAQPNMVLPPEQHFPVAVIGLHGAAGRHHPGPGSAHRPRNRRLGTSRTQYRAIGS
jgi:hypothetical protein